MRKLSMGNAIMASINMIEGPSRYVSRPVDIEAIALDTT
jgi:hypothetical protein